MNNETQEIKPENFKKMAYVWLSIACSLWVAGFAFYMKVAALKKSMLGDWELAKIYGTPQAITNNTLIYVCLFFLGFVAIWLSLSALRKHLKNSSPKQ